MTEMQGVRARDHDTRNSRIHRPSEIDLYASRPEFHLYSNSIGVAVHLGNRWLDSILREAWDHMAS